jgi:tRNA(Ile)-lysidine synthase
MTDILHRVRDTLARYNLLCPDTLIIVAVSGGPDSLSLLHLLWRLRSCGVPALHVAHLDHSFRGIQSAQEAQFVASIANQWNIPATVERYDVPALIGTTGQNKQATARIVRYAFLSRVALAQRATAVVVAHHADDQAETVLMHLLRGAGLAGLRGMRPIVAWDEWGMTNDERGKEDNNHSHTTPLLLRPLLDTTRAEIECYCEEQHLTPCYDPSNMSQHYTRNRIRADLLPHLSDYNQHIVTALGRTAKVCADDYAFLQDSLDTIWNDELVEILPGAVRFFTARWNQIAVAIQRYALRRATWILTGTDDLSFEHLERARIAATGGTGSQQTLEKGLLLLVEYESFVLGIGNEFMLGQRLHQQLPQLLQHDVALTVPGVTKISDDWRVVCSMQQPDVLPQDGRWCWWVAVDAETLNGPLQMRRRLPGDRFVPAGGRGSRRVQDFFVDQKIPRALRNAWPILATATAIVWVAGLRADARFQATDETQTRLWVILLTCEL